MWASATIKNWKEQVVIPLSYPLKCGLLQQTISTCVWIYQVVIPTQMWASATKTSVGLLVLSSCHTHSNVGFCNHKELEGTGCNPVVIPTQMWASATDYIHMCVDLPSCHTHSNVGFCNRKWVIGDVPIGSCHTHSNVGFCNDEARDCWRFPTSCHTHSNVGFCN